MQDVTPLELSAMFGLHVYAPTRPPCFRIGRDDFEDMAPGVQRHFRNPCGPDSIGDIE